MKYRCGTEVMLGDEILVQHGPGNESLARVVAVGLDQAATDIEPSFYKWARSEGVIEEGSVVVEWMRANPLAHNDPELAPVGPYMTLDSVCCETFVRRGRKPR